MTPYQSRLLKSNELIDRLTACSESATLDEIELKRIELSANKLTAPGQTNNVKASGYFVLGALAATRSNLSEMNHHFADAISWCDPEQLPIYRLNHVIATERTFAIRHAAEMCKELVDDYPDDITLLKEAIRVAEVALNFELGRNLRGRLHALGVDQQQETFRNIEALVSRMEACDMSSADLGDRIEIVTELLSRHKLRYMGVSLFVADTGESLYRFLLDISPEEAADLNFEIADALVSRFDNPMETVLAIGVLPNEREQK